MQPFSNTQFSPPPPPQKMSPSFAHTEQLFLPPPPLTTIVPSRHRAWKRRRLKPLTLRCDSNPSPSPLDGNLFHSVYYTSFLNYFAAPALGLALLFSPKPFPNPNSRDSDIGEWVLFASPTPFNRFVTLRCPSIYFPGNGDSNEKLVREGRHCVKLNSGRMGKSGGGEERAVVYQRICVGTEDGGVLSLDWPADLDLEEERGLDTTVLVVPGTAEGSNERRIEAFVCECLRRGMFPVVVNPRGCAGSPLTTARLFTAADSDDISTAVQYINKKRPWTTLMGVGWGYGANMLTKYLAEFGERTPLTAATCIDNPFDLEEASRSSGYHTDFDRRHTDGLITILQSNKELFQGQGKGFDVERALSASSTRDFERAISMVSHGFDTIEEFYAKSSTRDVIGKVKIPVLFIQNDDGNVPLFSIPRSIIAENPYTSLLLCSYSPSNEIMHDRLMFCWCQNLTLEWLTAVELGLLKGRHPLLKDVDVTINPSKGLALAESRGSTKRKRVDKLLNITNGNPTNPQFEMFQVNDTDTSITSRSTIDTREPPPITKVLQQEDSNVDKQSSAAIDAVAEDNEMGKVLQSTQVVMNMLDITMPDTLSDEQKKKVLNAVGRGETLITALQDAVPEDVRGKLTTAVSGILQSHGSNLNFEKLLSLGQIPHVASGYSKMLGKIGKTKENGDEVVHSSYQKKRINDPDDGAAKVVHGTDKPSEDSKPENHSSEISQEPDDTSNQGSKSPDIEKLNQNDMGNSSENEQSSRGGTTQISDMETVPEVNANEELPNTVEGPGGAENIVADQKKLGGESGEGQSELMEENNKNKNDFLTDQDKASEASPTEDKHADPSPVSETQVKESEQENKQRNEEKGPVASSSQNIGDPPNFSVSDALNALTGFDDSTQVAVNSVFNVIEDMIDKFELEKDNKDDLNNENNTSEVNGVDEAKESSEGHMTENDQKSARAIDLRSDASSSNFMPAAGELPAQNLNKSLSISSEKAPNYITTFPYGDPLYKEHLKTYLHMKMRNTKPPDMDKMSPLHLDYIPEEGQWKLLEQSKDDTDSVVEYANSKDGYRDQMNTQPEATDNVIEPSYVILDSGKPTEQHEGVKGMDADSDGIEFDQTEFEDSMPSIKNLIVKCLNVEVSRRASADDMEELEIKLAKEVEFVANAVSMAARQRELHMPKGSDNRQEKFGTLDGENIIKAISSAVQDTQYLRSFLPVGVVVGASLAELRKFFNVAVLEGSDEKNLDLDQADKPIERHVHDVEQESSQRERESKDNFTGSIGEEEDNSGLENSRDNDIMVGAVTAALGASALLAHQSNTDAEGTSNEHLTEKENSKELSNLDATSENNQSSIVTSLAEKAMSVASPVVPMKEDGEVDHERLVAMLTELGQKGGMLKLVGKLALLWGGIRGAMSLTEKLISFLHIAERPLFHRICGFVFLVLLLWSPIVLPLLPALMQSWVTHNPFKIAEFACIAGLYVSVMFMVTLWGKRIRKYDDPLQQYGLDLASFPKFQNFLKGLVGGSILVILIHAVNSSIGCAHLCWPTTLSSSSSEPVALIRSYWRILLLIGQGIVTAMGVSVVEELLFRSWLPQEIAADFGYLRGIIISGLVFALCQRSMWEIPGLWLLSLSLSGARQRSEGSLSLPIGLRTGILASNYILKMGGFLTYQPNIPLWVTGGHPFQPFSGVIGLASSLGLAVILYPRQQPLYKKKVTRVIRD